MNELIEEIEKKEISLLNFSQGFKKMGFNISEEGIIFREYAPNAKQISIVKKINSINYY
jgi:1,4-alpha-glucan branching enzyme